MQMQQVQIMQLGVQVGLDNNKIERGKKRKRKILIKKQAFSLLFCVLKVKEFS
jgi:hypothetical protein